MMVDDDWTAEPVLRIGDCFRISLEVHREAVVTNGGIMSPSLRVKDIRRDAAGILEVIIGPNHPDEAES